MKNMLVVESPPTILKSVDLCFEIVIAQKPDVLCTEYMDSNNSRISCTCRIKQDIIFMIIPDYYRLEMYLVKIIIIVD